MGLADLAKTHTPTENPEYGAKKKLIGDAVCEMKLEKQKAKASGKEWVILKGTVIHTIPDAKGRETTLEPGDEIAVFYDEQNPESVEKLLNDLFTMGVEYDKGGDDTQVFDNMVAATEGKLAYLRTWCKDKTSEQIEEAPDKPTYWQNIKVLSKNKVTAENSTPQAAF